MRILFDQGTPVPLRKHLLSHQIETAYERGWGSLQNGELLIQAEANGFDILVTTDQNLLEIGPFMEHVQNTSLQMIAIQICKIYEPTNKRFPLNSIPAIAAALDQLVFDQTATTELNAFGKVYAPHLETIPAAEYLKKICDHTLSKNSIELDRLKEFRDKVGAHSEAGIGIHNLPSHDVFERLFRFGLGFYRVIRRTPQDAGPYTVGHHVNPAFVRLLKAAGFTSLTLGFEE